MQGKTLKKRQYTEYQHQKTFSKCLDEIETTVLFSMLYNLKYPVIEPKSITHILPTCVGHIISRCKI